MKLLALQRVQERAQKVIANEHDLQPNFMEIFMKQMNKTFDDDDDIAKDYLSLTVKDERDQFIARYLADAWIELNPTIPVFNSEGRVKEMAQPACKWLQYWWDKLSSMEE